MRLDIMARTYTREECIALNSLRSYLSETLRDLEGELERVRQGRPAGCDVGAAEVLVPLAAPG